MCVSAVYFACKRLGVSSYMSLAIHVCVSECQCVYVRETEKNGGEEKEGENDCLIPPMKSSPISLALSCGAAQ